MLSFNRKKTWTQEEEILVAIYINLINMVNALTGHLPTFKQSHLFYWKLLQVKKIYEIFCFCKRLCWQMINTKLLKGNQLLDMTPEGSGPVTLFKKCEFCEISKNTFFIEHLCTTASMTLKYKILIVRSSHQRCSMKKSVLKNFTKLTGKQLCQSPFLNRVSGVSLQH